MVITKNDLERKYNSMKTTDLAKELKISVPTLLKILKENGIEHKGPGNSFSNTKIQVV